VTVLRSLLIWSILDCNEIKYGIYIYVEDNAGQYDR